MFPDQKENPEPEPGPSTSKEEKLSEVITKLTADLENQRKRHATELERIATELKEERKRRKLLQTRLDEVCVLRDFDMKIKLKKN